MSSKVAFLPIFMGFIHPEGPPHLKGDTMKQILCLSLLILLFVHVPVVHSSTEETISDVILKMRENNSKIHDMQCLFVKEITKKGKKFPQTQMTFKYLKEPETIFVEFLNRHKGQKCLYVEGENGGKIVVRPSGLMKFMKLKLDPSGKQAMEEDIDPMTSMGFDSVISSVEQWYQSSLTGPSLRAEFLRDTPMDGGLYHLLKIVSDTEDDGYIYLYVTRDTYLPYKVSYKIENNGAVYIYKNLQTNTHLTRDDFHL